MRNDHRKDERYDHIGRVEAESICPLPGVLDDISLTGCKVHFPIPLTMDMENDYTLKLRLSKINAAGALDVLCHPQWTRINGNETEIGFKILTNQNSRELTAYVENLRKESENDFESSIQNLIVESQATLI